MPYPNEHSCRLRDPSEFEDGSFRRTTRRHEGKEYSVIMGRPKGKKTMAEQAYRYDKKAWKVSEARSHCESHDGTFEPASSGDSQGQVEQTEHPLLAWLAANPYWPLKGDVLGQLCEIVNRHLEGRSLTQAEIEAATKKRKSTRPDDVRYRVEDGAAIIPVEGIIAKYARLVNNISGPRGTSIEELRADLRAALEDDEVDRIILDIESPGGNIAGLPDFADEIYAARQRKPVIAYANDLAASAAYWIGSQATRIYANQSAEIGSIGVYTVLVDSSRAAENAGLRIIPVASGLHKTTGLSGTHITAEQVDAVAKLVQQYYEMFLGAVERGRGERIDREQLESVADGRTFVASEAIELGLIDGIASLDTVVSDSASSVFVSEARTMAKKKEKVDVDLTDEAPEVNVEEIESQAEERGREAGQVAERKRILAIEEAIQGDAYADVRQKAISEGLTVEQAKALAYEAALRVISGLQAKIDEQQRRLDAIANAGIEPIPRPASDDQEQVEAEAEKKKGFLALAEERAKEKKISRTEAMRQLAQEEPELFAAWKQGQAK